MNYQEVLDDFIKDNNSYEKGSQKITYHHNDSNGKGTVILYSDDMEIIRTDYDDSGLPVEHRKWANNSFKAVFYILCISGVVYLKDFVKENLKNK
jgi:hypothetical protein